MKTKVRHQIRIFLPVFFCSFICGFHYTWSFANVEYFRSISDGLSLNDEQISLVASFLHLGRILAPILSLIIPMNFGRKTNLMASGLLTLVGDTILFSHRELSFILGARLLIGFGLGIGDISTIMYNGEVLSKTNRGIASPVAIACYIMGIIGQLIMGMYLTYDSSLTILLVLSICYQLSIFAMIESPYFLIMKGQTTKALHTIQWLQDVTLKEAEKQVKEISKQTDSNMSLLDFFRKFKQPEIYKSCCIAGSFGVVASLIGTTLNTSANLIFPSSAELNSMEFAICFNALLLGVVFISTFTINKVGRRTLLIPTFIIQAIMNAIVALLFHLDEKNVVKIPYFPWVIFISVALMYYLFYIGCQIPINVVRSEIFPTNFKTVGVCLNVILNSTTNFISSYLFLQIIDNFGMYVLFLAFSVVSIFGMVIGYFLLPETRGKTLAEIQEMLKT